MTPLEKHRKREAEITKIEKINEDIVRMHRKQNNDELKAAQDTCSPHIDDGGFMYASCKLCGYDFG